MRLRERLAALQSYLTPIQQPRLVEVLDAYLPEEKGTTSNVDRTSDKLHPAITEVR